MRDPSHYAYELHVLRLEYGGRVQGWGVSAWDALHETWGDLWLAPTRPAALAAARQRWRMCVQEPLGAMSEPGEICDPAWALVSYDTPAPPALERFARVASWPGAGPWVVGREIPEHRTITPAHPCDPRIRDVARAALVGVDAVCPYFSRR